MIDTVINQCYEPQVATTEKRQEPIKVTNILSHLWDTVSIDHGGLYPNDQKTKEPDTQ